MKNYDKTKEVIPVGFTWSMDDHIKAGKTHKVKVLTYPKGKDYNANTYYCRNLKIAESFNLGFRMGFDNIDLETRIIDFTKIEKENK